MPPHGLLPPNTLHLCVDMQRVFAEGTPWHTPWMPRVLPVVLRIAEAHAERTLFTRFMPPRGPADSCGAWRRYYQRWEELTLDHADPALFDLVPDLAALCPPARVFDKSTYSPWGTSGFERVLSGPDDSVLAAILGAVDRGYRVIVPTDVICSSSDTTHDALLTLYRQRFAEQIETASADEVLAAWA